MDVDQLAGDERVNKSLLLTKLSNLNTRSFHKVKLDIVLCFIPS